jgi:hypothetical protein
LWCSKTADKKGIASPPAFGSAHTKWRIAMTLVPKPTDNSHDTDTACLRILSPTLCGRKYLKAKASRKCEPAVAVNVGNLANLQRGLSFCCKAATTLLDLLGFRQSALKHIFD